MLDDLKHKAETWTPEMADVFHNNVPRVHPRKGGYIWPVIDNGFYHWGPDAVDFYRHDGTIFSVQEVWEEQDWICHQKLWNWSLENRDFRISEPKHFEYVMINGKQWTYTEIQYPGKDLGQPNFHFEYGTAYDVTKGYIDDTTVLLKYLHILNDDGFAYPSKVKLGNRILDSQGYFWKDVRYWSNSWENFYNKHVGEVQKIVHRFEHNQFKKAQELVEYAKESWKRK